MSAVETETLDGSEPRHVLPDLKGRLLSSLLPVCPSTSRSFSPGESYQLPKAMSSDLAARTAGLDEVEAPVSASRCDGNRVMSSPEALVDECIRIAHPWPIEADTGDERSEPRRMCGDREPGDGPAPWTAAGVSDGEHLAHDHDRKVSLAGRMPPDHLAKGEGVRRGWWAGDSDRTTADGDNADEDRREAQGRSDHHSKETTPPPMSQASRGPMGFEASCPSGVRQVITCERREAVHELPAGSATLGGASVTKSSGSSFMAHGNSRSSRDRHP